VYHADFVGCSTDGNVDDVANFSKSSE